MVKSSMLKMDYITAWILGPAIGFGVFLLVTLIFVAARKHFRNSQTISFLIFAALMLSVSITQMVMQQQASSQSTINLTSRFAAEPIFYISTILILATSLSYYIFTEFEVSRSMYWLRLLVITGIASILLATLADVGYLDFFPINQITGASGWISAAYLLSAIYNLASVIYFYRNKYNHFLFFGIAPVLMILGISLNILFLGSILISAITIWMVYLGLTATTLFEGMVKPTAGRIDEVNSLNQELLEAYNNTLEGWAKAMELRDKETSGHSRRVTSLATDLAKALNLSKKEQQDVRFGALLHDIGKMAIPDRILKKPGRLTPEERKIIETHPVEGYKLLEHIQYLDSANKISLYHHEKWDGSGYPEGLRGEEIPFIARLFTIVDVWDAVTSNRPYAPAWPIPIARAYIKEEKGVSFDPEIVDVFLRLEQTYKEPTEY